MTKQEAIINISTIFNRKSAADDETDFFKDKKHDDLLDMLLNYIEDSSVLIGNPRVFKTQSLNDHGVDLIVEYPNGCKIGVQVKSHFDVSENEFAAKVKAQFAESQFHGLDKWYLLICSPLAESKKKNYSSKISHLINELSSYKTSYHAVYSPQQMVNILKGGRMGEPEFHSIKNQYYFEEPNWPELIKELGTDAKQKSYLPAASRSGLPARTAALYNQYLQLSTEEEKQSSIDDLRGLFSLLATLSKKTREFLYTCVSRGTVIRMGMHHNICVLCQDIENSLGISQRLLQRETAILEGKNIGYIDDLEGEGINYSIVIQNTNPNYNILASVKEFCEKNSIDLESVIVNLDFSLFDRL